ncbi:hypothetical protein PV04_03648 [Phialophora macrospora]|uniref:BTB domain-containing protein n=1 Tax=Phialophora macrospora TaxID=1851006 RepID=A0A0D2FYG7_9EURO|nr:hypothetical protein PV04_03648 [Phialophora macrospora]
MSLPGRRYGEPAWPDPELHGDQDPALQQIGSYEEERLAKHYSLPVTLKGGLFSMWREPTSMSTFKSAAVPSDIPGYLIDRTAVVNVVVGTLPERRWVVHEHLLTSASRFAKAALALPFKEREERTLRLPEEDPDVFDLFVQYLYTSATGNLSMDMRIRLYVLADRMQATALCDSVRATLDGLACRFFSEAQLEYVFENTPPGDRLRRSCILRLGAAARSLLSFPYSDRFTKLVCQKYAGEIFAEMINKYEAIIMESAEDGSSVMGLTKPDPLTGSKLRDQPENSGSSPVSANLPDVKPLFGSCPARVSQAVNHQSPSASTASVFAKDAFAPTTPGVFNGDFSLFAVSASSTTTGVSQSLFGRGLPERNAQRNAFGTNWSNAALPPAKSTAPTSDMGSTEAAQGTSPGQQAAGGTAAGNTGIAMASATSTPTASRTGGPTNGDDIGQDTSLDDEATSVQNQHPAASLLESSHRDASS